MNSSVDIHDPQRISLHGFGELLTLYLAQSSEQCLHTKYLITSESSMKSEHIHAPQRIQTFVSNVFTVSPPLLHLENNHLSHPLFEAQSPAGFLSSQPVVWCSPVIPVVNQSLIDCAAAVKPADS